MRHRIKRNLTLALSLLLCLLLGSLWIRSHWVIDTFTWSNTHRDSQIASSGGRLMYGVAEWPNPRVPITLHHFATPRDNPAWFEAPDHADGFRFLGFEYAPQVMPASLQNTWFFVPAWKVIAFPFWALCGLAALHPTLRLIGYSRRIRRKNRGLCIDCGYDLRASGAICPECGATALA